MKALVSSNLGLRFLLELGGLAALAYWGLTTGTGAWAWALGVGAPLVFAVVWGLFVAPKAKVRLPRLGRFAIELGLFARSALALAAAGQPTLAVAFALLVLASGALNYATSSVS